MASRSPLVTAPATGPATGPAPAATGAELLSYIEDMLLELAHMAAAGGEQGLAASLAIAAIQCGGRLKAAQHGESRSSCTTPVHPGEGRDPIPSAVPSSASEWPESAAMLPDMGPGLRRDERAT